MSSEQMGFYREFRIVVSVSQHAGLMKYAIMAAEARISQKLRTGPLQAMWNIVEWRYSSMDSELRHWMQISVKFHALAVLHAGWNSWYPLITRQVGTWSQSEIREGNNRTKFPRSSGSLVTIPVTDQVYVYRLTVCTPKFLCRWLTFPRTDRRVCKKIGKM